MKFHHKLLLLAAGLLLLVVAIHFIPVSCLKDCSSAEYFDVSYNGEQLTLTEEQEAMAKAYLSSIKGRFWLSEDTPVSKLDNPLCITIDYPSKGVCYNAFWGKDNIIRKSRGIFGLIRISNGSDCYKDLCEILSLE